MPKRSNTFQKVIALINQQLAERAEVVESALLSDSITGDPREVDVLITASIAGYATRLAVECIDWKRKADVTWIEKMFQKHQSLPTDKLILVSRSGFSSSAIQKAEFFNITTLTLEDAIEQNWLQRIRSVVISTVQLHIVRSEIQLVDALEHATIEAPLVFYDPEGKQGDLVGNLRAEIMSNAELADALLDRLFDREDIEKMVFTLDVSSGIYKKWYLLDSRGQRHHVKCFRIQVKIERSKKVHAVQHGKYSDANIAFAIDDEDPTDIVVMVESKDGKVTASAEPLATTHEGDEKSVVRYRFLNAQPLSNSTKSQH